MEQLSFEERNRAERRTFHQIQQRIRVSRIAILVLIVIGLIGVTLRLTHSYKRYSEHNWFTRIPTPDDLTSPQAQLLRREIQDEAYETAVACMFFIVNAFGIVAVVLESFLLVTAYTVFNTGILLLSFTADNSLPHGLLFKVTLILLIHLTILFFFLMRSRRLS